MNHNDFADDLVYRPSLLLTLIGVAFSSAIGFVGAIIWVLL